MLKKYLVLLCLLWVTACDRSELLGVDQHAQTVSAAWLADQWLVINYWAVWCAPCRAEVPELNQMHRDLSDQGVRVLGVNYDQLQDAELLADSEALGIEFRVLSHDPAARFNLPATHGLPTTYIVNPQGEMVRQLQGEQTAQSLLEVLTQEGWSAP